MYPRNNPPLPLFSLPRPSPHLITRVPFLAWRPGCLLKVASPLHPVVSGLCASDSLALPHRFSFLWFLVNTRFLLLSCWLSFGLGLGSVVLACCFCTYFNLGTWVPLSD